MVYGKLNSKGDIVDVFRVCDGPRLSLREGRPATDSLFIGSIVRKDEKTLELGFEAQELFGLVEGHVEE